MSDLNTQLVREFLELHGFQVFTQWQRDTFQSPGDATVQIFAENLHPNTGEEVGHVLINALDLTAIDRLLVEVRAWHADRFYPSVIESNPVLTQFAAPENLGRAREVFGGQPFKTVLIISELSTSKNQRGRALQLFEESHVDHVIEFPTLLQSIVAKLNTSTTYAASTTLQLLRLLKRYRLIRNQQLEFAFPHEAHAPTEGDAPILPDVADVPDEDPEEGA